MKRGGNSSHDLHSRGEFILYTRIESTNPPTCVFAETHQQVCIYTHIYLHAPMCIIRRVRVRSTHLRCEEHAMLPQPQSTQRHTTHASRTIASRGTQVRPSSSHPLANYLFTYLLFVWHLLVLEARIYLFLNMYIYVESTSSCS